MQIPATQALRVLRAAGIAFEPLVYTYVEHGGTRHAAEALGLDEHQTVKTIVMETDRRQPLIVLMHGDREISTRQLARAMGARSVTPCAPDTATRHTGYLVGGTSPFGTRKALPVYAEATLFDLPVMRRAVAISNAQPKSAVVSLSTSGVFVAMTPAAVIASISKLL